MTNGNKILLGKKIIIISTDLTFLNDTERVLTYAGVDTIISQSLDNGLLSIKSYKPDLVIVHQTEKLSEGLKTEDLIEKIHDATTCEIPTIFLCEEENYTQAKENIHIDRVLPKKEVDNTKLISIIENVLIIERKPNKKEALEITDTDSVPVNKKGSNEIRVLIVEDDPLLRNLLFIKFTKSNIPFRFCHDGTNALENLKHFKPTLVLLDIMLPGKNGLDVLKEMRELPDFAKTPVIVFSNKDNDEDRKLAEALDAHDFLIKATTDLNDLITLIIKKHS